LAIRAGWKRWEGGKVADFVMQVSGRYPQRHELPRREQVVARSRRQVGRSLARLPGGRVGQRDRLQQVYVCNQ
jgi:hypothetical protein